jgi:hypothetical protein
MEEQSALYIFHLKRAKEGPVFFHDLKKGLNLLGQIKTSRIVGRYGEEPDVESLSTLRNELYRQSETAIRDWIFDLRFIPRFLLSTLAFIVTYFVKAYMIRDPLPIIDEFVLASVAAVVAYMALGKRFLKSDAAVKERLELRTAIDGIEFTESEFLKRVESYLAVLDGSSPGEALRKYLDDPLQVEPEWAGESAAFLEAIRTHIDGKRSRALGRKLDTLSADTDLAGAMEGISSKLDFSLFLLSRKLKSKTKV